MVGTVLVTIFFLLAPAGVMWACRRVSWLGKIGPVLVLYILGILVGNIFHPSGMAKVQDLVSSAMVPLAIPLMLASCTLKRSDTRSQLLALITGLVSVMAAVVAGYFIFGRNIQDGAKIGGMLTGVYTGGTINLASLKTMLDVPDETFILMNSYDMVISFLFLTFLLSIGIKLFRKFLPNETNAAAQDEPAQPENAGQEPVKKESFRKRIADGAFLLAIDAVIIGISAGIAMLCGDGLFMTVLILMLTTLGIAASFWKPMKKHHGGYDMGMYFIYIFSVVVASMADLSKIDLAGGLGLLGYLTFVIFGSLLLQVLFAWLFKIDSDTMVISSVSFICSPPFVPMMSAAMKNRRVLAAGLAIGVVGYAAGNYLGFLIAHLLELFG